MTKTLTAKENAFVEHYIVSLNGAQSARDAAYSERSARQIASRLLSKAYIQEAIQQRLAEKTISKEAVLSILGDIATGTMRDFVTIDANGDVSIDIAKAAAANKLHLVKKIKRTRRTRKVGRDELIEDELSIELYDKQAAAVTLARRYGLLVDQVAVLDWRKELADAGLDPAEEFAQLVKQAKDRLTRSAGSDAGRSDQGSEGTATG